MNKIVIPEKLQNEMMIFFLDTSIPRIMKSFR